MLAPVALLYVASILHAESPSGPPGWSAPLILGVGAYCHYHAVADLNGDGRPDLIVPTRSTNLLHVFMNQGAGLFASDSPLPSLQDVLAVATADMDRDGDHDLLEVGYTSQALRIRPNDGTGGFSLGQSTPIAGAPYGIDVADFNGDDWPDVVLTIAPGGRWRVQIFWNDGAGALLAGPSFPTGDLGIYVTAADLDADLDPDIVVSSVWSDSISVIRNDRQVGFVALLPFSAQGSQPGRVEVADVDQDGSADLIVPHSGSPWITRFEATGGGAFTMTETIQGPWTAGSMGYWVECADLDLNGRTDLVVGPTPVDGVGIALQDSLGAWGPVQPLEAGSTVFALRLVDLDGNGSPDIVASAHDSKALVIVFNGLVVDCNGNGIADSQDVSTGNSPDCNGNGVPDECDLASGQEADCDADGELDACEIAADPSLDVDVDGTLDVCEVPGTPFCFGDGSIPTLCPCVPPNIVPNPGSAPGHGCANSFNASGALLSASGTTAPDSVRFTCTISSNYANFALMVKGNASSPNGVQLNDGIMCVSGAIVRFGSHYAATGGAPLGSWTFPNTIQTTPVSIATAQGAGQHAYYQLYYRNAMPNFCTAATANLSNAIDVLWP